MIISEQKKGKSSMAPFELECSCEETTKGTTISLDVLNELQELQKNYWIHWLLICKWMQNRVPAIIRVWDMFPPQLVLHCLLCYLASGSHHDIWLKASLAKSTFFACVHWGVNAILKCPHLKIQFPTDDAGLKEATIEFQNKSSFGILDGCVGALDGWHFCIFFWPLSVLWN